ncbi:hypothetical protein LTR95_010932 [Oleoguttula sp. CCFEE 5521]
MLSTDNSAASLCLFTDQVPTEIRKQIFSYVLTKKNPISFCPVMPMGGDGRRKRVWAAQQCVPKYNKKYSKKNIPELEPTYFTALLATCKIFNVEASEVLFSCNVFSFPTSVVATKFIETIGGPKYAIKSIAIEKYHRTSPKTFWLSLLALVNLRTISIPHRELCQNKHGRVSLRHLQGHMAPLIRSLQQTYAQRGLPIDLRDLVQVSQQQGDTCYECGETDPLWLTQDSYWAEESRDEVETEEPEVTRLREQVRALVGAIIEEGKSVGEL